MHIESHIEACAMASRMLRHRLEAFAGEYPGVAIEDLLKEARHVAEELHEMDQIYNAKDKGF